MKKKLAIIGATAVSFAPLLAFAQTTAITECTVGQVGLAGVLCTIYKLIHIAIPVTIIAGILFFIFAIVSFIATNDAEKKGEYQQMMIHGVIGFAVILGLFGIISLLLSTFGLSNAGGPAQNFPTF